MNAWNKCIMILNQLLYLIFLNDKIHFFNRIMEKLIQQHQLLYSFMTHYCSFLLSSFLSAAFMSPHTLVEHARLGLLLSLIMHCLSCLKLNASREHWSSYLKQQPMFNIKIFKLRVSKFFWNFGHFLNLCTALLLTFWFQSDECFYLYKIPQ